VTAGTGLAAGLAAVAIAVGSVLVPADPPSMLDRERAVWSQLDAETQARYCTAPRRDAVREYADAIREGEHADHAWRLARLVLSTGCPDSKSSTGRNDR
jgi:hypothetical protein